jgi:formate hydrogenlyase subunit 4
MNPGRIGAVVLQIVFVVGAAPLLAGLIRQVRARLEGRVGPPIVQPWRDLRKLWRKERIAPEHTSWVFITAPLVLVASAVVIAMIVPLVTVASPLDQVGDLFAVVSLLLLGTVFLALAGLDPGTAFGGMGASREMTVAALAEPTLLLAVTALAARAGSTNLAAIVTAALDRPSVVLSAQSVLALVALGIVTLAECARLPVDNPSTHLELTMIHEAMVLEYAGPDLALVELAASMRLLLFGALLANLFAPWGIATGTGVVEMLAGAVVLGVKLVLLGAFLGVFEVFVAKLRLFRVPELLAVSFVVALVAVTASAFLGVGR